MPHYCLSGFSPRFQRLSRSPWAGCLCVTHPFATRLTKQALSPSSDLHVLGTPPAFILSQDRTLKVIILAGLYRHLIPVNLLYFYSVRKCALNLKKRLTFSLFSAWSSVQFSKSDRIVPFFRREKKYIILNYRCQHFFEKIFKKYFWAFLNEKRLLLFHIIMQDKQPYIYYF